MLPFSFTQCLCCLCPFGLGGLGEHTDCIYLTLWSMLTQCSFLDSQEVVPCILLQIVFGSIVLLMLWLPIRIIKSLLPNFLPYNVMLYR